MVTVAGPRSILDAASPVRNARPAGPRARAFRQLMRDVRACTACERMQYSHVLGAANGPLDARALVVAEAVGRRGGAVTGVPLTRDVSGQRFALFLAAAGIARNDVFITNAVLCNPLDAGGRNRPPTAHEVARCRPFLARTLDAVAAPVVITLGRIALESLRAIAPHDTLLARDVARPIDWNARVLIPMYHPSRQSTMHRAHERQLDDWVRLGTFLRARSSPEP